MPGIPYRQRPLHVKLIHLAYKCAAERPGWATLGNIIRSERDVFMLDETTAYQTLYERVRSELRTRKFSDPARVSHIGIHLSDENFSTKFVRITNVNWEGCREILLKDEAQTLRVEICNAPAMLEGKGDGEVEEEDAGGMREEEEVRRRVRQERACEGIEGAGGGCEKGGAEEAEA